MHEDPMARFDEARDDDPTARSGARPRPGRAAGSVPGRMETLSEALDRLEQRGFGKSFIARAKGQLEVRGWPPIDPEDLVLEETVRFEGQSDPDDEMVLFALRTEDWSLRGTFLANYGPKMEPDSVAAVRRLTETEAEGG